MAANSSPAQPFGAKTSLQDISVDEINATYKEGYLTKKARDDMIRRKAAEVLDNTIRDQGMVRTYYSEMIKHVQSNWDETVQAFKDYKPYEATGKEKGGAGEKANEALQRLGLSFKVMQNEIGALIAPFQAFGDVNGATAEHWAASAGASEGLAKTIGLAVNVGSNFVPIGKASQSFAKGVQGWAELAKGAGKAGEAIGAAGKVSNLATGAKAAQKTLSAADDAIFQGLGKDGVKAVEDFIPAEAKATEMPDFYKALRSYHDEIKSVTETKHLKDIEAEADALGIHLDDLKALGQGTALTPAQIRAYLKTLDEPTTDLIANARDVLKGVPEAGPIQDKLLMDYFSYTPKFRAAEVQAGRTVKVLDSDPRMKSITEMMKGWDPENAAGLNFDAVRRTIAEDLVAMANSPEKLKNLQIQTASGVIDKNSPTVWRRIKEAYSGILLMAPPTWFKNFMGNVFAATNSVVEREIAGAFSIDVAKGVVKGEGLTQLQGYTAAMGEALHAFGQSFKTMAPGEVTKFDFMPHANSGPLGRVLNIGHDVLRGTDNFFKTILRNGDLWATTFRDGKHLGLEGDALVDYAMRHRAMPSSTLLAHADDFALTQTYQNDLGTIGKMVQKATQNSPFYFWFPYTKTPMNLGKYAWYRTPGIQLFSESLYADIIAGGERADMAIARLTMGNMMGAFWFGLHRQGVLTDGGPLNPALRRAWSAINQPYAWRGKDGTQYPLPQMEPLTTSINLMSDFSAILNQLDEPTAGQAAMAMALSATKDIADKTYWQTVGQMFDVLGSIRAGEQPGPAIQRLAVSPLLAVTTGGALPGRAARIMDPVQREARGFVDQWKRRIPGYSETLPPMRDGYGDPILPPVSLGADWLGMLQPFTFKPPEGDRIKKEGEKLQVKLPIFPWNIGGPNRDTFDIREADPTDPLPVPLTPEQRDRWQRLYRDQIRNADAGLEKMLDSPVYKAQTVPQQRELFTNALAKMRAQAKNMLVATDPELQKAVLQSKAAGVLPMLKPDDRPQAQAAIDQAIGKVDDLSAEAKDNLMKWGYSADPGAERDQEVIRGYRGEINKSIPELNRGAAQESQQTPAE